MKKSLPLLALLLIPCLLLSACGEATESDTTTTAATTTVNPQIEITLPDGVKPAENKPLDQLTAYDYETVTTYLHQVESKADSTPPFLESYHQRFPIERMDVIDSNHVSVVYKLQKDSGEIVFAYIVFEQKEASVPEEEPLWGDSLERYFVTHALSSAEFSSVQPGDGYEKIAAIEPSLDCYTVNDPQQIVAVLLLTDGVLEVEFVRTEDDTQVKALQFYPFGAKNAPEQYRILNATKRTIPLPTAN